MVQQRPPPRRFRPRFRRSVAPPNCLTWCGTLEHSCIGAILTYLWGFLAPRPFRPRLSPEERVEGQQQPAPAPATSGEDEQAAGSAPAEGAQPEAQKPRRQFSRRRQRASESAPKVNGGGHLALSLKNAYLYTYPMFGTTVQVYLKLFLLLYKLQVPFQSFWKARL